MLQAAFNLEALGEVFTNRVSGKDTNRPKLKAA
jgi:hypothetical protein